MRNSRDRDTGKAQPRLGDFIRRHLAELVARWESEVRQLPAAQRLDRARRINHIPAILERIAKIADEGGERMAHHLAQAPDRHAIDRLDVGFDLTEVVSEYSFLRTIVLRHWQRDVVGGLHPDDVVALNEAFDGSISQSVDRFAKARERTLFAIDQITSLALDGGSDLEELLPRLLQVLRETAESIDTVTVLLRDGDWLRTRASVGLAEKPVGFALKVGEGFAGTVAAGRMPVELRSPATDPLVLGEAIRSSNVRTLYGVPMLVGNEVIGVVHMGSCSAAEFSEEVKFIFRSAVVRATALVVQATLRASEQRRTAELEAVIRSIPDAVYIGSAAGVAMTNQPALDMFGFDAAEDLARPIGELVGQLHVRWADSGQPLAVEEHPFLRALGGESCSADLVARHIKTGKDIVVRAAAAPFRVGSEIAGAVSILTDITERKRAEAALATLAHHRERFIGILGHDLRNPLAVILASTGLLRRQQELGERAVKSLLRIEDAARRMSKMIGELLDLTQSRLARGIPIAPEPIDLHNLACQTVEDAALSYPNRVVRFSVSGSGEGAWDPSRIRQALGNLVLNALQHSPAGTPVDLAISDDGETVRITVHNEGEPIPAQVLPHIFEPFTRASPEKSPTPESAGLGLGLFIVNEIVAAHRGTVDVSSNATGTTFVVTLPRRAPPAAERPG